MCKYSGIDKKKLNSIKRWSNDNKMKTQKPLTSSTIELRIQVENNVVNLQ